VSPDSPAYASSPERPGCLTAYAVLLFISTGLVAIAAVSYGIGYMLSKARYVWELYILAALCIIACVSFILARGLWQLKNWARILAIVLQSLGIVGSLMSLLDFCSTLTIE
jgi:hypothetical protein